MKSKESMPQILADMVSLAEQSKSKFEQLANQLNSVSYPEERKNASLTRRRKAVEEMRRVNQVWKNIVHEVEMHMTRAISNIPATNDVWRKHERNMRRRERRALKHAA